MNIKQLMKQAQQMQEQDAAPRCPSIEGIEGTAARRPRSAPRCPAQRRSFSPITIRQGSRRPERRGDAPGLVKGPPSTRPSRKSKSNSSRRSAP